MGGAPAPAPMGGASDVPPAPDGGMGGPMGAPAGPDPMAGPDDGGMPPMDGAADGNGQLDPQMDAEPPMGDEPPMDGEGGGDDSTKAIIDSLNQKHQETVRAYALSLRSEEEESGDNGGEEPMGDEPPMDEEPPMDTPAPDGGGAPMAESFVFTKKQLSAINENLPVMNADKKTMLNDKKKGNTLPPKSPFNSPKFN